MFGRVYGIALPASIGGIVLGSLIAPVLAGALGGPGALLAVGSAVLAYALFILRGADTSADTVTEPHGAAALAQV